MSALLTSANSPMRWLTFWPREASRRQIPVKARTGTWLLQFDQKPTYSDPPDAVFVQLQIRVFRDFPG